MLTFHSAKGGVGCSVVAVAVAASAARRHPTLLVDLAGDLPDLVGVGADGPGLADWLDAEFVTPGSLARLARPVTPTLEVLSVGRDLPPADRTERLELLARLLRCWPDQVVVDLGRLTSAALDGRERLAALASRSVIVSRACYLAISAGRRLPPADDVVLIKEKGRSYRIPDCAGALSAPVTVQLPWDERVARAVDSGLLLSRPPASLRALDVLVAP
ncbi:MAG: hypothetical protein ACRBI6_13650 [Acidimicrobiales bacterium]